MGMTKDEAVEFMLKSINDDNREICEKNSMPEEEIQKQIAQSQPTLQTIISNMYDRMKDVSLIA